MTEQPANLLEVVMLFERLHRHAVPQIMTTGSGGVVKHARRRTTIVIPMKCSRESGRSKSIRTSHLNSKTPTQCSLSEDRGEHLECAVL